MFVFESWSQSRYISTDSDSAALLWSEKPQASQWASSPKRDSNPVAPFTSSTIQTTTRPCFQNTQFESLGNGDIWGGGG